MRLALILLIDIIGLNLNGTYYDYTRTYGKSISAFCCGFTLLTPPPPQQFGYSYFVSKNKTSFSWVGLKTQHLRWIKGTLHITIQKTYISHLTQ